MKNKLLLLLPLAVILSSCTLYNSHESSEPSVNTTEGPTTVEPTSADSTGTDETTTDETSEPVTTSDPVTSSNQDTSSTEIIEGEDVVLDEKLYDEFWAETSTTDFKLDFKGNTLEYLSRYGSNTNSPEAEVYFPADLYITLNGNNYVYHDVGVRTKGNVYSRYELFNDGNYNGNRIHFKISFNETFDDELLYKDDTAKFKVDWTGKDIERTTRDERTLCGMKKLDLKFNKDNDPIFLRQAYASKLLREHNLMASRVGLVDLKIQVDGSKLFEDIYQSIEVINKQFLKKRLSKSAAKGDLYKCGWTDTGADLCPEGAIKLNESGEYAADYKIGVEDKLENKYYIYDLKTNETKSKHESLVNLIRVLDENNTVEKYEEDLENALDLEYFAVQQAVSYVIGSPDDLRNNLNNTYIYFNSDNKKAYILPTDFDQCLGINVGNAGNFWPTTTKFQGYKSGQGYLYQPLYWKTILVSDGSDTANYYSSKWPSLSLTKEIYKNTLYSLAESELLTKEYFMSYIEQFPYHISTNSQNSNFMDIGDYFNLIKSQILGDTRLANY